MLTLKEGRSLVNLARKTIEEKTEGKTQEFPPELNSNSLKNKRGIFVTLKSWPDKSLRGCIGLPLPVKSLFDAVKTSALEAAFNDPRFPPLQKNELKKTLIEVSVLTKPEKIPVSHPSELPEKINIGKDGLILKLGPYSALLLPQVAEENNWSQIQFLEHLCLKAGLDPNAWRYQPVEIFKFQAQIFAEETPGGKVIQTNLKK